MCVESELPRGRGRKKGLNMRIGGVFAWMKGRVPSDQVLVVDENQEEGGKQAHQHTHTLHIRLVLYIYIYV